MRARRRAVGLITAVVLAAGVFGAGLWAGRVAFAPPAALPSARPYTLVAAEAGSVGANLKLNASAAWSVAARPRCAADGVVTGIGIKPGQRVEAGQRLLDVNLRPVVAGEGKIPAVRNVGVGDKGDDVAQLEGLLAATGHRVTKDGRLTADEKETITSWQRASGMEPSGTVRAGDVVWFDQLPARVTLGDDVRLGEPVTASTGIVQRLSEAPDFWIVIAQEQAQTLSAGMPVEIRAGDQVWNAAIASITTQSDPAGGPPQAKATLKPVAKGSICSESCDQVPVGPASLYPATVTTVPQTKGVWVPTGALASDASGSLGVVGADGRFTPVTVVQSAQGRSIVEGLAAGTQVQVPGDPQAGR